MNKKKMTAVLIGIALVLGIVFALEGRNPVKDTAIHNPIEDSASMSPSQDQAEKGKESETMTKEPSKEGETSGTAKDSKTTDQKSDTQQDKDDKDAKEKNPSEKDSTPEQKKSEDDKKAGEKVPLEKTSPTESPKKEDTKKEDAKKDEPKKQIIDPKTGKDKYQTDPVPEGKPLPVEPQDVVIGDKKMTATLTVRCDTLLNNMDRLNPEKVELVPADGVIFPATSVTFYEGESVFNLLQREMKKNKIHLAFKNTPIYNSAYIQGIHNLYEFDGGDLSGWTYRVNGWFPNYGASRYQLKEGDVVEWLYTCDLGRDVGGGQIVGARE